uniref:Uncharacterized protein n=1 Tax=Rhizophora mucronata TaxID=61149 RepID=A0A2P2MAW1_RHIMU
MHVSEPVKLLNFNKLIETTKTSSLD